MTALHCTANRVRSFIAKHLLDHGANVNCRNVDGHTPLHYAAARNDVPLVCLLLSRGADRNAQDYKGGWAPLHYAVYLGHGKIASILVANAVDRSIVTTKGNTADDLARKRDREQALAVS